MPGDPRGMPGTVRPLTSGLSSSRRAISAAGTRCRDICVENGLVMRAVGDTMIVSPPLVFEDAHVDELVEKAWKCLDLTAKALGC